jgi:hypothetical protein
MQKISLKLPSALHATAEQMAAQRNLSIEHFLYELLDAEAAAHRLRAYKAKSQPRGILRRASSRDDSAPARPTRGEFWQRIRPKNTLCPRAGRAIEILLRVR